MIWSSIFVICITQGVFLVSLLVHKGSKNILALRLVIALLAVLTVTNLGYIVIRTGLIAYIPQLYGVPFGMLLLLGPLLYLYSRSITDSTFQWDRRYWLHFVPYCLQLLYNLPFLLAGREIWADFASVLLSGEAWVRQTEKILFLAQDAQLWTYLFFTFMVIRSTMKNSGNTRYLIPLSSRIKWITSLAVCFVVFGVTCFGVHVFFVIDGRYNTGTNYVYSFLSLGIFYFIAYRLLTSPEQISPDFSEKYRTYMPFVGEDGERYVRKLRSLMSETKIFTNPDLSLAVLAEQMELPAHQLSKLINEKFSKSFTDFVNEFRVNEFINRISTQEYRSYSIYGLALDVGFNSKSSFNAAFKKITGKSPAQYKPPR